MLSFTKRCISILLILCFTETRTQNQDQCISDITGCRYRDWPHLYDAALWRYITGGCCYATLNPLMFNRDEHNNSRLNVNSLRINATLDDIDDAICRYRDWENRYPASMFSLLTGHLCFEFPPHLGIPNNYIHTLFVPVAVIDNQLVFFDYTDSTYVAQIRPTFSQERFFYQWSNCSHLADDCCRSYMNETNVIPNEEHVCPAVWDAWNCWSPAKAGETLRRPCPSFAYTAERIECVLEGERYCLDDGWDRVTNYETCAIAPILRRRHFFHLVVLAVSSAIALPAILIYIIFMRKLQLLRIILHRNLLIAIVLKNIFTIMVKDIIILDSLQTRNYTNSVMVENSVGCRTLSFFDSFATTAVFTCMFLIGLYLHKSIVRVYSKDFNIYLLYAIVIVFSLIPSLAWAIVMGVREQKHCWVVDNSGYQWITDAYKILTLFINLILLLDIIRVIWTRRFNLNSEQAKSAMKAILVLIPLFGLPLLITSQRGLIDEQSCTSGDIYYFIAYSVEALQGILLAVLFCYLNKDVHMEIKRSYTKLANSLNTRYGMNLRVPMQARTTTISNLRNSIDASSLPQKKTENSDSF